jgi:hypothetical protein
MNTDQIAGVARTILSAIGGYFVGKGLIDQTTMISVVGALVTLGTGVWSVLAKRPTT